VPVNGKTNEKLSEEITQPEIRQEEKRARGCAEKDVEDIII